MWQYSIHTYEFEWNTLVIWGNPVAEATEDKLFIVPLVILWHTSLIQS